MQSPAHQKAGFSFVKHLTAFLTRQLYNPSMIVCGNCHHKRSFHKKVDGNAWCSISFCACKNFVEQQVPFNRRLIHEALDKFLDDYLAYEAAPKDSEESHT